MDIRKLNPKQVSGAPADRAAATNDARRLHEARRAAEARKIEARETDSDVVDTSHADKVQRIAVRARAVIDDRTEKVRGREDELRAKGDDADAIRRAARRVLALIDRAEFREDADQDAARRQDGDSETPTVKV